MWSLRRQDMVCPELSHHASMDESSVGERHDVHLWGPEQACGPGFPTLLKSAVLEKVCQTWGPWARCGPWKQFYLSFLHFYKLLLAHLSCVLLTIDQEIRSTKRRKKRLLVILSNPQLCQTNRPLTRVTCVVLTTGQWLQDYVCWKILNASQVRSKTNLISVLSFHSWQLTFPRHLYLQIFTTTTYSEPIGRFQPALPGA